MPHNSQGLKVKLQPRETPELEVMYNFLFDVLNASWAGAGHYAYDDDPDSAAPNQDGFIYCFKKTVRDAHYTITADSKVARNFAKEWLEIEVIGEGEGTSNDDLPKLLKIGDVLKLLSISRKTLERLRKNDSFPEPCFLVGSSPRWRLNRLLHILQKRKTFK